MPTDLPIDRHSFRRLGVLTGALWRRQWTAENTAIVDESFARRVARTIALRHGLLCNQLDAWRRELR